MANGIASTDDLICDYLLFVATKSERDELEAVATELQMSFSRRKGRYATYYDLGIIGASRVFAVRTDMGPFSYRGSAARAIYCMIETRAMGMISLGMAFGIDPSTQKVGDVLVSTFLLPYDDRVVRSANGKIITDYTGRPHKSMASLVRMFQRESAKQEWRDKVSFGDLLSGGARIHCRKYRDELVQKCKRGDDPIIGGDMEGVGFLSASNPDTPTWVVVKGICDFADESRDAIIGKSRPIACRNAARFVLKTLRNADNLGANASEQS